MDTIKMENASAYQMKLFEVEADYDESAFQKWIVDNWALSFTSSAIYALVIFGGKTYMENRPRFELRYPLALWSGILAIFSILGTIRSAPQFFEDMFVGGMYYSLCDNSFLARRPANYWCYLFSISKIYELGDTVFIVLRKQPLIFLHYYHHITVLLYVWYSYPQRIASGRWFMMLNYFVHSLMYTYYTLRALKFKVPRQINVVITFLQLAQMIIGLSVNIYTAHMLNNGIPCAGNWTNFKYSIAMYVSYFILFAKFFYDAYIKPKPQSSKKGYETNGVVQNGHTVNDINANGDLKKKEE